MRRKECVVTTESYLDLFNLPITELFPILDLREPEEFHLLHIGGAFSIPLSSITTSQQLEARMLEVAKELSEEGLLRAARRKVVVCSSSNSLGERENLVIQFLLEFGLPLVQNDDSVMRITPEDCVYAFGNSLAEFAERHPYFIARDTNERYTEDSSILRRVFVPSQITPWGLYLGGQVTSGNEEVLRLLGISLVINLTVEIPNYFEGKQGLRYMSLPSVDKEDQVMLEEWQACFEAVVTEHAAGGRVLVHCAAGRSRSASAVVYCLIRGAAIPAEQALSWVQRCREVASPNPGFTSQLQAVEMSSQPIESFSEVYKICSSSQSQ